VGVTTGHPFTHQPPGIHPQEARQLGGDARERPVVRLRAR